MHPPIEFVLDCDLELRDVCGDDAEVCISIFLPVI